MAVTGTLGATLGVSATPLASIIGLSIASFQPPAASYTTVGFVENLGEFGRQFEKVTFVSISDARTLKLKGPYDDGTLQLGLGADISDAGQAILFSASQAVDQNTYPMQIILVGASVYDNYIYFGGKIMSFRFNAGAANAVFRATVSIEVNTAVFVGGS
jgi:hypothetical protein